EPPRRAPARAPDGLRALGARAGGVQLPGPRRARGRRGGAPAGRAPQAGAAGAARAVRAGAGAPLRAPLAAQLLDRHAVLPARLVHDEVQPEGQREGRGAARLRLAAPAPGRRGGAGHARAAAPPAGLPRGRGRAAARHAPARGGRAGRALRAAPDAGLLRGPGQAAADGRHPRLGARHEPGVGGDGGLRGRPRAHERARRRRPRRPALEGRRGHRRADADEPVHARAVRGVDRRDRGAVPRRRRAALLRRREPERGGGPLAAGRHGLRHRPLQHPQDVLDAARRRWPGRRSGRGDGRARAVPARADRRAPRGRHVLPRPRPAAVDRQAEGLPRQRRGAGARLRLHPRAGRGGPAGHVGVRRAERQLPPRAARGRHAPALPAGLQARVRALGQDAPARARRAGPRHRQAADRLRDPPADDLLPAARRGGADDRADRDGVEGDARPLRGGDARDPARGGRGARPAPRRAARGTGPPPRRGQGGEIADPARGRPDRPL
ncbi:MAG: Glycine dehydrogenase [decarboxylating] (glycine cleavage system P2 protein), partial [uncultured Thermoleophilia bacterium]